MSTLEERARREVPTLETTSARPRLRDKVAVVTGGAKGMGGTISELFAREGAALLLAARDLEALDAEVARIRGAVPEVKALSMQVDVTDEAATQAMVRRAIEEYGRVDVLVNAAGVTGPIETPADRVSAEAWDEVLDINAKGTFLCCKAVLPHMMGRRYGKIVNIAGTSGLRGYKHRVAYSSSKWAVRGLTRTIALDAGPYSINVNCVAPGPLYGPRMTKIIHEKARVRGVSAEAIFDEYLSEQALARFTTAVDVAYAVLFLATDEARQITGQTLTVDGGWDV
jgi:NAD(P)-dependent dehydrogenase (short-subunit alcohol dehydrogenase family)